MWCFNQQMLRAALLSYRDKLIAEHYSPAIVEACCTGAMAFLCSEEARKLRVRGEDIEAAVPPMEVEELELEEVPCNAIGI
ncbi:MAG: hypothetical protein HYX63_13510 [Gammaproteobacteria bacterium]|nr:hypothetical protein [Gammaproteobacteria bacterium]